MPALSSYSAVTSLSGTERVPVVTTPGVAGGNKYITAADLTTDLATDAAFTSRYIAYLSPSSWSATDNSATIQAAIDAASAAGGGTIMFPPNLLWKIVAPLVLKPYVSFKGPGHQTLTAGITTAVGDLFVLGATNYGVRFDGIALKSLVGGGHVFNTAGFAYSTWHVSNSYLLQSNDAKSVLSTGGSDMLDCQWDNNNIQHTLTATVPTFNCISNGNAINCNSWTRSRFTYSGNYSIHIENNNTGYCADNRISDINFEVCNGGEIRLLSCRATRIDGIAGYDGGTYTKDRVYIGKSTPGPASIGNILSRVARRGGTLGGGISDIHCVAGQAGRTVIDQCNGVIDLGSTSGNTILALDSSSPAGTVSNAASDTAYTRPAAQVDVYTSGTTNSWTKPAWATTVTIAVISGGCGGGSGRRGAVGTVRCGGGGGAGGSWNVMEFAASDLPSTLTANVGAGGAGGAAITADDTNGNNGAVGLTSLVQDASLAVYLRALPGGGGGGGTAAAGTAGGSATGAVNVSGPGAAASTTGLLGAAGGNGAGAGGGGSGAGVSAANVESAGGAGGMCWVRANANVAAGGAIGLPGQSSNGAPVPTASAMPGHGGGGGGSSITAVGGAGGAGAAAGGGGGGGGASLNGNNSGAGGAGGAGRIVFVSRP